MLLYVEFMVAVILYEVNNYKPQLSFKKPSHYLSCKCAEKKECTRKKKNEVERRAGGSVESQSVLQSISTLCSSRGSKPVNFSIMDQYFHFTCFHVSL